MCRISLTIPVFLAFSTLVEASNGTAAVPADNTVGWTTDGNTRSSFDIIWSCLTIFVICSWKCVHLNVPSDEESEAGWHKIFGCIPYWPERLLRQRWWRKIGWMLTVAIAPEFGVYVAANDYLSAREVYRIYNKLYSHWTMTHSFYAQMGGFALLVPIKPTTTNSGTEEGEPGSAVTEADETQSEVMLKGSHAKLRRCRVTALDLAFLDSHALFPATTAGDFLKRSLPVTTEDDVKARSTSDLLTKALAVFQCGWFIIQCLARKMNHLQLSQLELATLGFIFCAVVMYLLWWHKPFGVERPTALVLPEPLSDGIITEIGGRLWADRVDEHMPTRDEGGLALFMTALIFCGIHIAAWNWEFPQTSARIAWRVFSLTSLTPAAFILVVAICDLIANKETLETRIGSWILSIVVLAYVLSRLGLIVLVFYCFKTMPATVYVTVNWTAYIPHFS